MRLFNRLLTVAAAFIVAAPLALSSTTVNAQASRVELGSGVTIVARTDTPISSDTAPAGSMVTFFAARDVEVFDERTLRSFVVIETGAPITGQVANSEASGSLGEGGNLVVQLQSVQAVDGQEIAITGSGSIAGSDNTGSTVAMGVLLCPLFLLREGEAAVLPAGYEIRARTAGNHVIRAVGR